MESYQFIIRKKQKEIESLEFNLEDVSLKNTSIKEISRKDAKEIIIKYEWLKTMPLFNRYYFGIYFNINDKEYLGGVVIYSQEYSANKLNTWNKYGFTGKLLLLSRGVCLWWTPKNTASYFISKTTKWLKKNTDYKIITATVDPAAGEIGTIYQSLNWHYVGLMRGNYGKNGRESKRFSIYINGKLKQSRSIRQEFGTIKKEVILKKYPDAIFVPQYRKRRYFYFIGTPKENKEFYLQIKHLILEYPKRNNEIAGIIYSITNKINNKKYIGQTTRGLNDRYLEYKNREKCCNFYVLKAFNKYGFDNFEFKIIDTAQTLDELNYKEIRYISEYNAANRNFGYNIELGGVNSLASLETKDKLSKIRKEVKQNNEWIEKRLISVSKPVIKINLNTNVVLERFNSAAIAAKSNTDGLSYEQIIRKCLAYSKNNDLNAYWCYEDDYINNNLRKFKESLSNNKALANFSKNEINEIYEKFKEGNYSIRELSNLYSINFATLLLIIKKKERPANLDFDGNKAYIAICKKTKIKFRDYLNKSGTLTSHIKKIYPDINIESKFKRKNIELKTGKPWYYDYFDFIEI